VASDAFELPSGKHAGTENFPVASRLVRAALRPHLAVFYGFARAIDDVADAPDVDGAEKRRRLVAFDAVLAGASRDGPEKARALKASLDTTGSIRSTPASSSRRSSSTPRRPATPTGTT